MCSEMSITQTSLLSRAACQRGCVWKLAERSGSYLEVQEGLQDHEEQESTPESSVLPSSSPGTFPDVVALICQGFAFVAH